MTPLQASTKKIEKVVYFCLQEKRKNVKQTKNLEIQLEPQIKKEFSVKETIENGVIYSIHNPKSGTNFFQAIEKKFT